MNKKNIDEDYLRIYKDVEIKYPFCYKVKLKNDTEEYFRYLEDGRFENIKISKKNCCLIFGCRSDYIKDLINDDGFYFKVLSNINEIITNEDFIFAYNMYLKEYDRYLSSDKFLSKEVKKIIDEKIIENERQEDYVF